MERDLVPVVQEAGWALRSVWMGLENLAPTRVRIPDHPASSESLYQVYHLDHHLLAVWFF